MPYQSTKPGIAASSAPTTPAPMFQNAAVRIDGFPMTAYTMSKTSAVTQSPSGMTTSIGWIGCLPNRAPLSAIAEIPREQTSSAMGASDMPLNEGLRPRGGGDGRTQYEAERDRGQHDQTHQRERERHAAGVAHEAPERRRQRRAADGQGVVQPVGA